MTRKIWFLSVMMTGLLAGCAEAPAPTSGAATSNGTAMSQFTSTPVAGLPQCSRYKVTADGKQQLLTGEACRQADGSWHIAEQPGGSTTVYQTVYWPPDDVTYDSACADSVYAYPCFYGFPFGFSIGFPVFIDAHHQFHHFAHNDHFHYFMAGDHFGHASHFHDGFYGSHNFHGGFGGGFHGGYAGNFHGGGFHHS